MLPLLMEEKFSYTQHLNSYQWKNIYQYLCKFKTIYVLNERECRRFVEAVFWMARSGAQWRFLPRAYGAWNSVYRLADWADKEIG